MAFSSVSVVSNSLHLRKKRINQLPDVEDALPEHSAEGKVERGITRTYRVNGMMCKHCSGRVEKALNALNGVTATVDLEKKTAYITLTDGACVTDKALCDAVTDAGYEVISIS